MIKILYCYLHVCTLIFLASTSYSYDIHTLVFMSASYYVRTAAGFVCYFHANSMVGRPRPRICFEYFETYVVLCL